MTRIIRICLEAGDFGTFRPFFLDRRRPICKKDEQKSLEISCFEVGDFKKSGFAVHQGIKRSQCRRIGEYFNEEETEIRLFKTRFGLFLLP